MTRSLDDGGAPAPPRAESRPVATEVHGTRLVDPYAWLKAENWKEVLKDAAELPEDIRAHLARENAYTEAGLAPLASLQAELVREMRARIKEDDTSVPTPDGRFAYLSRFGEGGQHASICRTPRDGGAEATLLDGDVEAQAHAYFDLGATEHSPDHDLLGWSADVTGAERFTIRTRDIASGQDAEDEVAGCTGDLVWSADSAGFYYVQLDDNHRPARVLYHRRGDPAENDRLIYQEPDPGWYIGIDTTSSRGFLVISGSHHETSEARLLDLRLPPGEPVLVAEREDKVLYDVEHLGDELVIRTNDGGAEDFKLVLAPISHPGRENWRDLVPHCPGIMVLSHRVLARHIVRLERENANPRIVVREIATGEEHAIAFDEEAYSLGLLPGYEFDTETVRFVYSSLTTPGETYDYDLRLRTRTLRKRQEVPSGFDPSRYVTRRIFGRAPDGEQVPISLLHRADLPRDGSAPCLLYGYGAYGMAMPASFRTNPLSLVDRGFVYAIAHVRGGTEKGWRWYLDGKRERKPNTFTDFVACAEALIEGGFTGRGRIVAQGGSAGGMLMGAVANLAGDLFAGIAAEVPFVDVLNTMLDGELPLTPGEYPEWGDPGADEAAFRTILAYSPYENVAARPYPPILALGGLTDPRVTYWEPAKWVARLRDRMTGGGPIFLRINMEAGHAGAAGRFDRLEEVALVYGFAIRAAGEGWPAPSS